MPTPTLWTPDGLIPSLYVGASVVTPEQFGANPGASAAVNGAALQAAFNTGGYVYLSGIYQCDRPLYITNKQILIEGAGARLSGIVFNNCDGIIIDNSGLTDASRAVTLARLTLFTNVKATRTALSYTATDPIRNGAKLICTEVEFAGTVWNSSAPDPSQACWATNVVITKAGGCWFDKCHIYGVTNDPSVISTYGFRISNMSRDIKITDSIIDYCLHGVYIEGDGTTNAFTGSEGIFISGNHFVATIYGITISPINQGVYVNVSNNHFAVSEWAVNTGNADYCQINDNFCFRGDQPGYSADTWYGVILSSKWNLVKGNVFFNSAGGRTLYGVRVYKNPANANSPAFNTITDNAAIQMNGCVVIEATASDTSVYSNKGTFTDLSVMTPAQVVIDAGVRTLQKMLKYAEARRTSGALAVAAGSVMNPADATLDFTIPAALNDLITYTINAQAGDSNAGDFEFNVAIYNNGAFVRYLSGTPTVNTGINGWVIRGSNFFGLTGTIDCKLAAADIFNGTVTLKLLVKCSGARSLFASTDSPLLVSVKNHGQVF